MKQRRSTYRACLGERHLGVHRAGCLNATFTFLSLVSQRVFNQLLLLFFKVCHAFLGLLEEDPM
jgi:hypothetical protein